MPGNFEGTTRMTAIVRMGRDGTINYWNPAAERLFGFTESEAIGNPLELIIPPQQHACHRQGFARFVETGISTLPETVTAVGRHKDGRAIKIQISRKTHLDDGGCVAEVEGVMLAC
jgi:PAS domain S-box-containing protein